MFRSHREKRLQVIKGRASHYVKDGDIVVRVYVEGQGVIEGDYFVDCSGGLGVVNTLLSDNSDFGEAQSYEDHLCGYVGSIRRKIDFPMAKRFLMDDSTALSYCMKATWHVRLFEPLLLCAPLIKVLILTRRMVLMACCLVDFFANPQFVLEAFFRFGIGFDFKLWVFAVLSHPDGRKCDTR